MSPDASKVVSDLLCAITVMFEGQPYSDAAMAEAIAQGTAFLDATAVHWQADDGYASPRCRPHDEEPVGVIRVTREREHLTCERCIALVDPRRAKRAKEDVRP